jgi:hypothetical protein
MSPQPHEGPAEGGLACLTLSSAESSDDAKTLRDLLSCFNHRCRNSLNGIKMSLYLYKRELGGLVPENLGELERSYHQLEVFFDWLQMIYRPLTITLVRSPLGRFLDERLPVWRSRLCTQGRTLELVPPPGDLPGDFDPMFLALGLDAIVDWRAEVCERNVKAAVSWRIRDGSFDLRWEERRTLNGFHADTRDDAAVHPSRSDFQVDSLAQVLLKRIVSAHGGFLETQYHPAFVMTVRWPQLQTCGPERPGQRGNG